MTTITAIPMKDDHIAGHFAKAERFVFIDEQGTTLKEIANPVAPVWRWYSPDSCPQKGVVIRLQTG